MERQGTAVVVVASQHLAGQGLQHAAVVVEDDD